MRVDTRTSSRIWRSCLGDLPNVVSKPAADSRQLCCPVIRAYGVPNGGVQLCWPSMSRLARTSRIELSSATTSSLSPLSRVSPHFRHQTSRGKNLHIVCRSVEVCRGLFEDTQEEVVDQQTVIMPANQIQYSERYYDDVYEYRSAY